MSLQMNLDGKDRRKRFKMEPEPLASVVGNQAVGKDDVGAFQSRATVLQAGP